MDSFFEEISKNLEMLDIESKEGSNGELMIAYCGLKIVLQRMAADINSFRFDVKIEADFERYNRRQLLEMANQLNHESDSWKLYVDKKGMVCAYYAFGSNEKSCIQSHCCSMFLYYLHLLMISILTPLDNYDGGLILLPINVKLYENYFLNLSDIFENLELGHDAFEELFINDRNIELRERLEDEYRSLGRSIAYHTKSIFNI